MALESRNAKKKKFEIYQWRCILYWIEEEGGLITAIQATHTHRHSIDLVVLVTFCITVELMIHFTDTTKTQTKKNALPFYIPTFASDQKRRSVVKGTWASLFGRHATICFLYLSSNVKVLFKFHPLPEPDRNRVYSNTNAVRTTFYPIRSQLGASR